MNFFTHNPSIFPEPRIDVSLYYQRWASWTPERIGGLTLRLHMLPRTWGGALAWSADVHLDTAQPSQIPR